MESNFIAVTVFNETSKPNNGEQLCGALVNTDEIVMIWPCEKGSLIVLKDYETKILVKETAAEIYMMINKIYKNREKRRQGNAI